MVFKRVNEKYKVVDFANSEIKMRLLIKSLLVKQGSKLKIQYVF